VRAGRRPGDRSDSSTAEAGGYLASSSDRLTMPSSKCNWNVR